MNGSPNLHIPVKYINSVCRVCLAEQELLIPIHELNLTHNLNSQGTIENVSLSAVFLKYCNIRVHILDNKPQKICVSCMNAICTAYTFFELFQQSNALLEKILEKHKIQEQEKAIQKKYIKNVKTEDVLDILPLDLKQFVLPSRQNDTGSALGCPVVYTEIYNSSDFEIDKDNITLPQSDFDTKNDVDVKPDFDSEDKEVAMINENDLNESCMKNGAITVTYRPKRGPRIKTPPFYLSDPTGSLKDHNYFISENYFGRLQRKRLKRKIPIRKIPIKLEKIKPVKITRQENREMQKKFERENDIFTCKFCRKTFQGIDKVLEHIKEEHPVMKRCILCPVTIQRPENMMYHVASHSKYGLICRICRLYFEDKESLERHKTEVDHSDSLKCHICGRTFQKMSKKKTHMEGVHQQESRFKYQCSECGLVLKWKNNLVRHERTHQEISKRKIYLCQICGKRFTSKYASELHVKVVHEGQRHLVEKHKKPKVSGKSYKKMKKLDDREKKIIECAYCERKFTIEHAYLKHCLSHPEYNSIRCSYCVAVFDNADSYREHRTSEHNSFICSQCGKGFPSKWTLKSHLNTHSKKHRCTICNTWWPTPQGLESHKRVHTGERPYKCDYCPKAFKQSSQVRHHIMCMHTQKNYKCNICGKAFNYRCILRAHIRTHTGEKPFGCLYCEKHFRDTVSRHKHVKRDHPDKMEDYMTYKKNYQEQEVKEVLARE